MASDLPIREANKVDAELLVPLVLQPAERRLVLLVLGAELLDPGIGGQILQETAVWILSCRSFEVVENVTPAVPGDSFAIYRVRYSLYLRAYQQRRRWPPSRRGPRLLQQGQRDRRPGESG